MKKWGQEKPGELKSPKCKKSRVFSFFYHFFHLFYHSSMVSWKSSDFAKCASHFSHFLVENAAKHKKSMKKSKKMMRHDKKNEK